MGKTVIVAGGGTGLGWAVSQQLVEGGSNVIVLAPTLEQVENARAKLGCVALLCDVSDHAQVEAVVKETARQFNRIDALVNSAGVWIEGPLAEIVPAEAERAFQVNVLGALWLMQAVASHMKEHGGGRIINIVSMAARAAKAERSVYNGTKGALASMTDALALELAPRGINVCGIYPGPMRTPFYEHQGKTRDMSVGWLDPGQVAVFVLSLLNQPADVMVANAEIRHLRA